jgi:predicted bacteriocin transport accessory protein
MGLVIALASIAVILVLASILEESGVNDTTGDDITADYDEPTDDEELTNADEPTDDDDDANDDDIRRLVYVGNSEMYEILNDASGEGFFVYIGRPTCPHCAAFEPTLEETLRYLDQELFYYQIDLAREGDAESEMTMSEIMEEIEVTGVPRIVYIEDGLVIDSLAGNRSQEDVISFFDENGGLN